MNRPKVLVTGNNTIDLVFVCDRAPLVGEKGQAKQFAAIAGGQAANAAVALSSLGIPTEYAGCFGEDYYGTLSGKSLTDCGIETVRCVRKNCPQHLATITVSENDNERTIVMYRDPRISADDFEPDESWLTDVAVVYTDGHELGIAKKLAKLARSQNVPMLADAENAEGAKMLLPDLSSLIAPERVILELAMSTDLDEALRRVHARGPMIVIATMGKKGSRGYDAHTGSLISIEAHPCSVVDSTGAGDAYHAGYIAAVMAGMGMQDAMSYAARVASAACECLGPRVTTERLRERGLHPTGQFVRPERGKAI